MTRAKAQKVGIDIDNATAAAELLTLLFSLKSDSATKMEAKYAPPSDWDDQEEITALIKVITQHRRREAGVTSETRHPYVPQETKFLVKYFEDHKEIQGADAMSKGKRWEILTAKFNTQFKDRKTKVASKGGKSVAIGERS